MRTFKILAVLLLVSVGVAGAQTIDNGRGEIPLTVPSGYDEGKPAPLIVLLHGYTSSGQGQDSYMKVSALADEYGFLLIAPDGTKEDSDRAVRFWNASKACCNFHGSEVDDSAYIQGLIDAVKADYNVDDKMVYLIGHSNGGFMSYRMAYDHSDTIAAIASLAGASLSDADLPAPSNTVHVLQIHGTKDSTIAYEGSQIGGTSYPSARECAERWATFNGCAAQVSEELDSIDLDKSLEGNETKVTRFSSKCKPGGATELWTIEGGGHIPRLSDTFTKQVVEWLLAHPKAD